MITTEPFVIESPADLDHPWRVLAGGDRTGGAVTFGGADLPPHSPGPRRHVHTREDEAVYVISGVLSFCIGERRFDAGPRTLVWMPRQVPHQFANLSDEPVHGLGVITPAGLEGLFAEQEAYFSALTGTPDIAAMDELLARFGVAPVEGPPLLSIPRS